jgi:1-deoxy-D-xylulose-5-phosphate reductoisomerase
LDFERPDLARFPCLRLAYEAHAQGGYATIALNAANEEAVQAFLQRRIGFTEIPMLVEHVMHKAKAGTPTNLDDIIIQDAESRQHSLSWLKNKKIPS